MAIQIITNGSDYACGHTTEAIPFGFWRYGPLFPTKKAAQEWLWSDMDAWRSLG